MASNRRFGLASNSALSTMRISSVAPIAVRSSTAKMAEAAWLSASRRVRPADTRGHQQRGEQVAGAVRADRQFWRAHAPGLERFLGALDGESLDLSLRCVGKLGAGDDDRRWPARHQRARRLDHLIGRRGFRPAQPLELEMIGRDDIRKRAQPVAHQRRDVGVDEQAAVAIAEHGIAAIAQRGVFGLGALRRSPRPRPRSRASRDSPTGSSAPYRPRRAPRSRAVDRRPVAHRAPGRGWSDSPAGCSTAWSARQSRRCRASASETPRRCCRHGRRRPATGLKSRSCDEFWGISFFQGREPAEVNTLVICLRSFSRPHSTGRHHV